MSREFHVRGKHRDEVNVRRSERHLFLDSNSSSDNSLDVGLPLDGSFHRNQAHFKILLVSTQFKLD